MLQYIQRKVKQPAVDIVIVIVLENNVKQAMYCYALYIKNQTNKDSTTTDQLNA